MDLLEVGDIGEGLGVTKRNVDDAVVSEGGHGRDGGRLLATAGGAGGDEEAGLLAPVAAGSPDATGLVPESLQLETPLVLFYA